MEKKNVILLTVIAVATLLITVVGATFAYYSANVTQTQVEAIDIQAIDGLAITYDDGDKIEATNIIPGWNTGKVVDPKGQKTITVTNDSGATLKYTINWYNVNNGFYAKDASNLKYNINASSTKEHDFSDINKDYTAPNDATTPLVQDIEIENGEVHTYIVKFRYENASTPQDTQGASFTAQFIMEDKDVQAVFKPAQ